jgi:hypothetical protein
VLSLSWEATLNNPNYRILTKPENYHGIAERVIFKSNLQLKVTNNLHRSGSERRIGVQIADPEVVKVGFLFAF